MAIGRLLKRRDEVGAAGGATRAAGRSLAILIALANAGGPVAAAPARTSAALKSMAELRDENLVRQRFDYSCGAAALATLLRFGWDDRVTEQAIIADLLAQLPADDAAIRRKEGFSLFDLQQVAEKRGYAAQGFRLAPDSLPKLRGPVIVFLETMGYKHFAVLKGIRGDRVYLADPARGNIRLPAYRFLQSWMDGGQGVVFVVEPKGARTSRLALLAPPGGGATQPELLGTRELLAIGPSLGRLN